MQRDFTQCHTQFTMGGEIQSMKDVIQFLIDRDEGVPKVSFDEMAKRGIMRTHGSDGVVPQAGSPYDTTVLEAVENKRPYPTLTGRQQFYMDHDTFLAEDEALPGHREPLRIGGYPLQMMMGHARHGVHSTWRDDPMLLSLQRGEPDIYINPDDAKRRGVEDGDLIRVFNPAGSFVAMSHVSAGLQPGMMFMYAGWDPMMFRDRQNFGAVIPTAGLLKPTSLVSNYGHVTYRPLALRAQSYVQGLYL